MFRVFGFLGFFSVFRVFRVLEFGFWVLGFQGLMGEINPSSESPRIVEERWLLWGFRAVISKVQGLWFK